MNEKDIEDLADRILKPAKANESGSELLARADCNGKALAILGQLAAAGKDEEKDRVKD